MEQSPEPLCAETHQGEISSCKGDATQLERALLRLTRAFFWGEKPEPELDALPMAQLRLLWTVRHASSATMKDFSERLSVSQSTVTQIADRLIHRGLIERFSDSEDRRVVRLRLSPAGESLLARPQGRQQALLGAVWKTLASEEQHEIIECLLHLSEVAEAVHQAQGRTLPPWDPPIPANGEAPREEANTPQPLLSLMNRRVRGKALLPDP